MKKSDALIWVVVGVAVVIGVVSVLSIDNSGDRGSGLGDEFTYDISGHGKVDEKLVLYKELPERIDTGMKSSRAIAVAGKKIYVAGDNKISVVGGKEIELSKIPLSIAVGADGRIYVGMGARIEVYDSSGKQVRQWLSDHAKSQITSIAVHKGKVFAADIGWRAVHRFDLDLNPICKIGLKDEKRNIDGFVIPSPYFDLAVAKDGLLRVVNPGEHRIEAYTFDGDLEFWWGQPGIDVEGFSGCCNPINFAILKDGSFVTVEKGLVRVKLYDEDGKFVGLVAGPETLTGGSEKVNQFPDGSRKACFDVAVDDDDRIYVLDTLTNSIRIFVRKLK